MFWGAESKQNAGRGRTLQTLKPAAATQNKDEEMAVELPVPSFH